MGDFQLIAFDLDGTLLDSEKRVRPSAIEAIEKAASQGKTVIFSSGRTAAEMADVREQLPIVRYAVCNSGASVYDLHENKSLVRYTIPEEVKERVLEVGALEDIMYYAGYYGRTYLQASDIPQMDHWLLEVYRPMFDKTADKVEDIRKFILETTDGFEKINLFHTDPEARARSIERIRGINAECVNAEEASLEITARNVTKANGIRDLCDILGIRMEQTIAVGDSYNDLAMLEAAGLSVAMGNARKEILEMADVIVDDNDHDGCAQAIYQYLL